jgi:hypothetical protein
MRLRTLLAAVALATSGVTLPATAAHAVSVDVTCTGTEAVTFQPGLLLTPQSVAVTVNGILAPCTSSDPGITSGAYLESFTATLSCANLLDGFAGTRVFEWNNGRSSTFAYNRAVNVVLGQITVTFTGMIVSGEFAGDTAVEQVASVTPNSLKCLAPPGITSVGPHAAVLTIASP